MKIYDLSNYRSNPSLNISVEVTEKTSNLLTWS